MTRVQGTLRVAQVSSHDSGGGAERIAWSLFEAIRRQGQTSYLAVGKKTSFDPDVFEIPNQLHRNRWARTCAALKQAPIARHARSSRVMKHVGYMGEPRRYWDMARGVEDFNFPATHGLTTMFPQSPQVIHAHNLHGGYFDLRALPALSRQVPLVLTLHDAWLLSGHCAHSFGCERWQTGCGSCPDLTIYPAIRRDATAHNWRRKRDIFARSALYVATPSQWLMDKVRRSILQQAVVASRVIPNGVDLSLFHAGDRRVARYQLGLPQEARIALFVGHGIRGNPWKDYATMEAAMRRVAVTYPEDTLLFLCLGESEGAPLAESPRVRFIGYQRDPNTVAAYYRAANVYLHAAHVDTFPTVVLEALACGTPVIATAVGGIPEQIEEGHTGFLVPPGDSAAMAARLHKLLSDDHARQRMGSQAAESAQRRFCLDRMVVEYIDWYRDIAYVSRPDSSRMVREGVVV